MGAGISLAPLARAVARAGQIGVVSGTALDYLAARRLQDGDRDGDLRRALRAFPDQEMAGRVLCRYYRAEGRRDHQPCKGIRKWSIPLLPERCELMIAAAFAEIWLAREGLGDDRGPIGLNLMEKLSFPNLPCLYGALLAGLDLFLVGAGIPAQYPQILERLIRHEGASLSVPVRDLTIAAGTAAVDVHFDPGWVRGDKPAVLQRPLFFPIISSDTLAAHLMKRSGVDGFVVEGPTAGGHNAPPRGRPMPVNDCGEPIYGPRDEPNLDRILGHGVPVYLAGGYGHPENLRRARERGAAGVQVGTPFALCAESGLAPHLRERVLDRVRHRTLTVQNSATASPTGLPFHVVPLAGTVIEETVYASRQRICDIGVLAEPCMSAEGRILFRCPAEPVAQYVRKGGDPEDAAGRRCLCNGLLATAGWPHQRRGGKSEPPIVTLGEDFRAVEHFVDRGQVPFTAHDVLDFILSVSLLPQTPLAPVPIRSETSSRYGKLPGW
jgi:NAD(P)H-dependent flavin oxidoreductase YrpB (nitropropane dioxygenase family)